MDNIKTPVSILQEFAVHQQMVPPLYSEVISDNPSFPFKCIVKIGSVTAQGYALTKKGAKHNSAHEALLKLGVGSQNAMVNISNSKTGVTGPNYIGLLNEHASKHQVLYPQYNECMPQNLHFVTECQFLNLKTVGRGPNKKQAKQEAAKLMLEKVETEKISYNEYSGKFNSRLVSDEMMEKVLLKYNSLQICSQTPLVAKPEVIHPRIENHVETMEDLLQEMEKLGHTCNVEVFQRNPYIIVLKIDKNSSAVMGHGETKQLAMTHLFQTASYMLRHGFNFSTSTLRW